MKISNGWKLVLALFPMVGTLSYAQWTNPPTPDPVPGPPQSAITALRTEIRTKVPKPTNTWTAGYALTTSDGGTTTYAVATGGSETDPIYQAALTGLLTKTIAASIYSTGTPIYAESDPLWSASSNLYATTNSLAILSLKHDDATNKLETVFGWGNHATNGYIVQGGNITGRWFAVGNTATGDHAFVGGGIYNSASGEASTIGGGIYNTSSGEASFVGGGAYNSADGNSGPTVVGGRLNTASGEAAFVGAGNNNSSIGSCTAVVGGRNNSAGGIYATIPGGYNNAATTNAFAAGINAKATNEGSFVWSGPGTTNGNFGSHGDNTFNVRSVGGGFFLMPFLRLMDTNGVQWAYLSPTGGLQIGAASFHAETSGDIWHDPTNTAVLGILSASYIGNTNGTPVLYSGESPTISQWSVATAALSIAQTTIATLTAQVASLIAQIPALSNYVVASDSTITGLVAAASVSWTSTTASLSSTNAWLFTQVTNRDHTVTTGLQASIAANLSTFSSFTNTYASAITNVDAVAFGGTIKSGFMLASAWEDIRTNVVFGFLGTVALTNSAGAQNYMKYNDTNTWFHNGTDWKRWSSYGF